MTSSSRSSDRASIRLSESGFRRLAIGVQKLDQPVDGPVDEVLEGTGFLRTLGGADVYLAARARVEGFRRADLDAAVARRDFQIVPAARGCIHLVARRHVGTTLRLAESLSARRDARDAERAGIRHGELDDVSAAVLEVLAGGPLSPQALRKALPDGVVRSLGDAGKKVGISSTLPPALRRLEFRGRIERTPETGRLDGERYRWGLPDADPLVAGPSESDGVPDGEAALHARVAAIFFRAAGLATRRGLADWSGLNQTQAKRAMAGVDLVPVEVAGLDDTAWAPAEYRRQLADPLPAEGVVFLAFEDNLVALHGGPALFVAPAHHDVAVPAFGRSTGSTLGTTRHSMVRTLLVEEEIAGLWERDPATGELVVALLGEIDTALRHRVKIEAEALRAFLTDEIGHGKTVSIDTDESIAGRCRFLETLGADRY